MSREAQVRQDLRLVDGRERRDRFRFDNHPVLDDKVDSKEGAGKPCILVFNRDRLLGKESEVAGRQLVMEAGHID